MSRADRALGLLAGTGQTLPNPYLLSQTLMRREAVLSSRIEGTQASLSDLVLFEVEQHRPRVGDVREVANYVRAMELVGEGILTEATGRQRDRIYLAREIVTLLDSSTE